MLDEDLESQSVGATMFPFLSVLFCTIGALVIIMVIGSLRTTVKDEGVDVKIEDESVMNAQLENLAKYVRAIDKAHKEMLSAQKKTRSLKADTSTLAGQRDNEKASLADMKSEGDEAVAYLEKVDLARMRRTKRAAHGGVLKRWQASRAEVDTATGEKDNLGRELDAARNELATLKREAENPVVRIVLEEDPAGRKPVLIELGREGVLVRSDGSPRPEGASIPKTEAAARGGFLDELAGSLARQGSARYAALFVRPEAVDLFFAATEKLDRWRVPYTAEPVEGDWELVFTGPAAAPE